MKRRWLIVSLPLLALLSACSGSESQEKTQAPGADPETTVGVITMEKSDALLTVELPGRATSYRSASIRPQVSGIIKAVDYKEGRPVQKGDLLFEIDDAAYAAAEAEAEATLSKAQASVPSAQANYDRYKKLLDSGSTTEAELDTARVTLLQAKADVAAAEAGLKTAKLNLDNTKIKAPFDGIADVSAYSIGNLVSASQSDALTTVRQLNPIYVKLSDSSANLLKIRSELASGAIKRDGSTLPIHLTLENGQVYDHTGTFETPAPTVDETTGSFSIRISFDNPDRLIMPGMFVRATLSVGKRSGYLIPQRAASRDSDGNLTARFVTADEKVETRTFKDASASGNAWLVTTGIQDGDKLIIDGLQTISDGMAVKTTEVKLDDDGVAEDAGNTTNG